MSTPGTLPAPEDLRTALADFWSRALKVEATRHGLALALPQTGADGWQLVVELTAGPPGTVRVSDAGRTLGDLVARGQNIEAEAVAERIGGILRQSLVERDGLELFRWLPSPPDPVELHVFAEALGAVSHLAVLHDPTVRTQNLADQTLQRVFADRGLEARRGARLDGRTEKRVRVDYLVTQRRPVAIEVLRRRTGILGVMEQWGYRWQDLQKITPELLPVMVYDPAQQEVDEASRAIGEEVCALFCAYDDTQRIHEVLSEAA